MTKPNKKQIFLALAAAAVMPLGLNAENAVKIIDQDRHETVFMLDVHPSVTFEEEALRITSDEDGTGVAFEASQPYSFEFCNVETTAVGSLVSGEASVKMAGDAVEVFNFAPNSILTVSNLSGMAVKKGMTDAQGSARVQVGDLPAGVYIFNSEQVTYKFYKR